MHNINLWLKKLGHLNTPLKVQKFLRSMPYNREANGVTCRSAVSALKKNQAHCLEACFVASLLLEPHGYPPLVMSFESVDLLDHVVFVFNKNGRWGSIARSRDEGLHGRAPVFKTLKALARSYQEPYIDKSGRIRAFQIADLDETGANWRAAKNNVFKVENFLIELPHQKLLTPDNTYNRCFRSYKENGPIKKGPQHWW